MTDRGVYLYAVTRAGTAVPEGDGLDGGQLRAVEHRSLLAVVSDVGLDDYGESGLRTRLEDLGWLETVARTHDEVVRTVTAAGPTAPFRLATVFYNDESLRKRLDECYSALDRALDRVEGRMEWSVKALLASGPTADVSPSSDQGPAPEGQSGAAYLLRKRAEKAARERQAETAAEQAERLHRALSSEVVASRRLAPQDPRLTSERRDMVLNAAYLVDKSADEDFLKMVARLRAEYTDLEISVEGPWPPYSFATLDEP